MRERPVSHVELQLLGDDPEALAGVREFGRFRVLCFQHASWILPVLIGLVIVAISWMLPITFTLIGAALGCGTMIVLMVTMLLDNRNSIRRDSKAYVDRGIIPCILCGTDRAAHEDERSCRGCGVALDIDSLRVFWEMRVYTTVYPKKDDPDVIKPYLRINYLMLSLAPLPCLIPAILGPLGMLGPQFSWVIPAMLTLYPLSALLVLSPMVLLARLQKTIRRTTTDLDILFCPECMHDLRGLPSEGVCPECGRIYSAARVRAKWWVFDLRWILKHGRRVADGR